MSALDFLDILIHIVFISLGILSIIDYFRYKDETRRDVALMFGILAIPFTLQLIARINEEEISTGAQIASVMALVLEPYLLLRLVRYLQSMPAYVMRLVGYCLVGTIIIGILVGDRNPLVTTIVSQGYLIGFNLYAMIGFARGVSQSSGVRQKRLRFAAAGSGLFALIFIATLVSNAVHLQTDFALLLLEVLTGACVITYYIAFAPPRWLRQTWQLNELHHFLHQTSMRLIYERKPIFEELSKAAIRASGGISAVVAGCDPDGSHLRIELQSTPAFETDDLENETGALRQAWQEKKALAAKVPAEMGVDANRWANQFNAKTIFIVPITGAFQTWGLLIIATQYAPLFPDDDLDLLTLLAQQSAIQLDYSALIQELRLANQSLEQRVSERTGELKTANRTLETQVDEFKQAQQQIEYQAYLLENVNDAVIGSDQNSIIRFWNSGAENLLGWTAAEVVGRPGREILQSEFPHTDRATVMKVLTEKGRWKGDTLLRHKDGSKVFIESSSITLHDDTGVITGYVSVNRDITERRKSEEVLRASEERFRLIVEAALSAMITVDSNGKIHLVNLQAQKLFGYGKEELLGRPMEMLVPARLRGAHTNHLQGFFAEPSSRAMGAGRDLFGLHKDGHEIPIEIGLTPYESSEGFFTLALIVDITERKHTEELLRISEERFRLIVNTSLDAVIVMDAGGYITEWNAKAEETFGWSEAEVKGRSLAETIIPYDAREAHRLGLQHFLETGEGPVLNRRIEVWALRRNGETFPAELTITPLQNVETYIFSAFLRDITERKKAEQEIYKLNAELEIRVIERTAQLQESEEKFSKAFLASPAAVSIASLPDGRYINVNEALAILTGYSKEELLGHTSAELGLVNNEDRNKIMEASSKFGFVRNVEIQIQTKSKQRADVLTSIEQIEIGGRPCLLSVNYDITERKRVESEVQRLNDDLKQRQVALSEANALLQTLMDNMPDHIYFKDKVSRFVRNSRSQAIQMGVKDPSEVIGRTDFDFFPKEHAQRSYDQEQELMRSNKPLMDIEERVVWPDGHVTWVSTTKMPLRDTKDNVIGTFGISRDITERKQAEEELQKSHTQLEAANKELEAFSYSVSHDLRAPLRTIDGFSQAVMEDYGEQLPEQGREYLTRVRKAAQHMAQLIDDLLNLSRVARALMKLSTVDLTKLAQDIIEELQRTQPERNVNFTNAPNLKTRGDSNLLRVVLENLLNNAWKFTSKREQAEIEIGSKHENEETIYFVRDNGAGFDMAYTSKLFGAFQRLHAMTDFPGTGVGLATVQRIIHRHGGRIWAEAELDQGATFFFTLHAAQQIKARGTAKEKDSIISRAKEII